MSKPSLRASHMQLAESGARHSVVVFLIIFTLVDMDIMAVKDESQRMKLTATWLAWGIPFLLLAFFFISPEQDAIALQRVQGSYLPNAMKQTLV